MTATLTEDGNYLILTYDSNLEMQQTNVSFTRYIRNAKFRSKRNWNGQVKFIKFGNRLPVGLWNELRKMCSKFGYELKIYGLNKIVNEDFDLEYVTKFCNKLLDDYKFDPDPDQIKSIHSILKYKKCFINCSTSFGKTLVSYTTYMILRKNNLARKVLMVTIDAGLVIQANQDYIDYACGKYDLKLRMIHGKSRNRDIEDSRMVIGNFQTLANMDQSFFEQFDCIICDEAHRSDTASIKKIMEYCSHAKYKVGMSGSVKDDGHAEYYDMIQNLGPIVQKISKRYWIDKGMATDLKINILILDHAPVEHRRQLYELKHGGVMEPESIFREEQKMVRNSEIRIDFLADFINRLEGNVLVFFLDKLGGYGKKIVAKSRGKKKEVFYIDGDVDQDLREQYKERMEMGSDKVLVASYPTYSTGKSIKNINHIVLAESRKSFEELSQVLGRGMRNHEDKDVCTIWDIVDDYSITSREHHYVGYMMKHMNERIATYMDEELEFTKKDIKL